MDIILLKKIEKTALIFAGPLVIIILLYFNNQPKIAGGFLIGMILGIFRLKSLFGYIVSILESEKSQKNTIMLIRYLASTIFTLGLTGFLLFKNMTIGLSILLGLIAIPIIIMIYAIWQGISLYRKN